MAERCAPEQRRCATQSGCSSSAWLCSVRPCFEYKLPAPHLLAGLIEKRVLIFRLLRSALCEALARVQGAAALLYLQQQAAAAPRAGAGAAAGAAAPAVVAVAAPGGGVGHAASAADIAAAAAADEGLFQRADRLVTASLAEVADAFAALDRSVHATLDAQQGPAAPPVDDQQASVLLSLEATHTCVFVGALSGCRKP